jgi:hypothetical protein
MSEMLLTMLASLRFLHATLVHKFWVYRAGRRLRVGVWQLFIHDMSKFRAAEYVPYGRFFYRKPGAGWLKASIDPEAKPGMLRAWLTHIFRNPHHWQHWCLINGASVVATRGTKVNVNPIDALRMPTKYVREMVADWMGAGRAYNGAYPADIASWGWWQENKRSLVLHPEARADLTRAILDWFYGLNVWVQDAEEKVWSDPPKKRGRPRKAKAASADESPATAVAELPAPAEEASA